MRLAVITTHPIQYYAPVFQRLAATEGLTVKVFYTAGAPREKNIDPGFGENIVWDIPLTSGYDFEWVNNTANDPGSHHFKGIVNPDLIDRLKSWQPDGLLVYGWAYASHLKVLSYFKGRAKIYFRGDSTLLDETHGIRRFLKTFFLTWVFRHVDQALYVGTNNKAYFKRYGLKDAQLSFAPHAIDIERFAATGKGKGQFLRQQLGIKKESTVILFAGKMEEKKMPELLLEAFIALKQPDTHLVFAGEGVLRSALEESAGGHQQVHFLPFQNQSQMPGVYDVCDLFCLPSKGPGETWGLAVNEAMACGKAVLVSDKVGCAADLVIPGITGEIFRSADRRDLSAKLNSLINTPGKLEEMGLNAKKKIADWSFDNQVAAIVTRLKNGLE